MLSSLTLGLSLCPWSQAATPLRVREVCGTVLRDTLTAFPEIPSWNHSAEPAVDSLLTQSLHMWNRTIHSKTTVFISRDSVLLPTHQWA